MATVEDTEAMLAPQICGAKRDRGCNMSERGESERAREHAGEHTHTHTHMHTNMNTKHKHEHKGIAAKRCSNQRDLRLAAAQACADGVVVGALTPDFEDLRRSVRICAV